MLLFFRPRLSERLKYFVERQVKVLETLSEFIVGRKAGNEVGIFDRLKKARELSVGLADEAKDIDELEDDNDRSEQCRKM